MVESNLTPRQQKWRSSVRDGLERDTGKPLAEWIVIARSCPESTPRARQRWLKVEHGLLQNRAMWVLDEAFGNKDSWDSPGVLLDALWSDPTSRAILDAVDKAASTNSGTIRTVRKSFTAWSRKVQFAALRPLKNGGAILGCALPPSYAEPLSATRHESWSERLKSRLLLVSPSDVDADVRSFLMAAWETS